MEYFIYIQNLTIHILIKNIKKNILLIDFVSRANIFYMKHFLIIVKKNNIEYIFCVDSYEDINWKSTSIKIKTPYLCMALTKNKKYCKNKALCNSNFCKQHHKMIELVLDVLMINK